MYKITCEFMGVCCGINKGYFVPSHKLVKDASIKSIWYT